MNTLTKLTLAVLGLAISAAVHADQIRNFQTVVSGSVYRAGTTAKAQYNNDTLTDLCEQGFTIGIFLYAGAKTRTVKCGGGRSITYFSMSNWRKIDPVINQIVSATNSGGRAIFHCWNGVHATGFVAAAVLNRLCGFSGHQAAVYFRNGVPSGSLAASVVNSLANSLESQPTGSHVMAGCPAAR